MSGETPHASEHALKRWRGRVPPFGALIVFGICNHLVLTGSRVAVSLDALAQGANAATVGALVALFALLPMFFAIPAGRLADLLWRRERHEEALQFVERALALDPGFDGAWQRLDNWSFERNDGARVVALAESLAQSRPADARAWVRLARLRSREPAAALATIERALAADPRSIDAHDLHAQLLAALGRHGEALASCRPAVFSENPPHVLQGRAAWIEHPFARGSLAVAGLLLTQRVGGIEGARICHRPAGRDLHLVRRLPDGARGPS